MSRQDKVKTEQFTRTLRELVKRPENKVCSDCKKNDPRWASWNLGVFLCIRCSGIHRSMGTHISRVKSVDLDLWTPEQMESIQKWGNARANAYWEAHLKQGHVPPEHKIESFIRSKYESRRWAMEGPVPSDPSVLDGGAAAEAPAATPVSQAPAAPSVNQSTRSAVATQPAPRHSLLSSNFRNTPSPQVSAKPNPAPAPAPAPAAPNPAEDLFSLDFNAPASASPPPQAQSSTQIKDKKQDILSLFSAVPAQTQPAANFGASPWGQAQPQAAVQQQPTSLMGGNGAGMWGVSSGWQAAAPAAPASNVWGAPAQQQPNSLLSNNADIWGSSSSSGASGASDPFGSFTTSTTTSAKDDAFGDIWGGFK